ncbi:hypothetical protein BT93_H1376 [Corymbia citriodora subsp. variegata]|nr:hypothetical protein BT93_H1376 [Corymbia citriodora subsp. variegata]
MAQKLTEDIVVEILSSLPVKSLMRFKCVSKQWWSLISGQRFARLYLQRSCNGLVCLSIYGGFILYNSTTKESRNLPDSELVPGNEVFHGFGYDSASDDYKIVKVAYFPANDGSKECVVEIFSLRSSMWSRIPHKDDHDLCEGRVYLNDAVCWEVSRGSGDRREQVIVSFNLAKEEFQEVLPIPRVEEGIFEGTPVHAWIMKEYGNPEFWMKWFSILTEGLPASQYYNMILFDPEDRTFKNYSIEYDNIESAIYLEILVSSYLDHKK